MTLYLLQSKGNGQQMNMDISPLNLLQGGLLAIFIFFALFLLRKGVEEFGGPEERIKDKSRRRIRIALYAGGIWINYVLALCVIDWMLDKKLAIYAIPCPLIVILIAFSILFLIKEAKKSKYPPKDHKEKLNRSIRMGFWAASFSASLLLAFPAFVVIIASDIRSAIFELLCFGSCIIFLIFLPITIGTYIHLTAYQIQFGIYDDNEWHIAKEENKKKEN